MAVQNQSRISQSKASPLAVGRYQLIGRAGTGIANAYRARDPDDNLVAVYLFPEEYARSSPGTDRLKAAFEVASSLDHPNVLSVIDYGREGDFGYLVTEWAEGTTLARLIEVHTRLPEGNMIRFLAQIGQALDHARQGDSVPFRVSSANVLIRADGVAKVIPFEPPPDMVPPPVNATGLPKTGGAAKTVVEPTRPKPMPFAEVIFTLGTLLYEALTGIVWARPEPPPPGRRRYRPPPRPVGLTERTEKAIRRTTDPDLAKRPASCADLLKLLRSRPLNAGTPKPDVRPTAGAADNRRAYVRYSLGAGSNCTIHSSVFEDGPRSTEIWPLVVQDVSLTGIGILLARRCEPGTELSVELLNGPDPTTRSLSAKVVRVRKEQHGHWIHGCEFLTPLKEPELNALINYLSRSEPM